MIRCLGRRGSGATRRYDSYIECARKFGDSWLHVTCEKREGGVTEAKCCIKARHIHMCMYVYVGYCQCTGALKNMATLLKCTELEYYSQRRLGTVKCSWTIRACHISCRAWGEPTPYCIAMQSMTGCHQFFFLWATPRPVKHEVHWATHIAKAHKNKKEYISRKWSRLTTECNGRWLPSAGINYLQYDREGQEASESRAEIWQRWPYTKVCN